jgi:hypothetical protein
MHCGSDPQHNRQEQFINERGNIAAIGPIIANLAPPPVKRGPISVEIAMNAGPETSCSHGCGRCKYAAQQKSMIAAEHLPLGRSQ